MSCLKSCMLRFDLKQFRFMSTQSDELQLALMQTTFVVQRKCHTEKNMKINFTIATCPFNILQNRTWAGTRTRTISTVFYTCLQDPFFFALPANAATWQIQALQQSKYQIAYNSCKSNKYCKYVLYVLWLALAWRCMVWRRRRRRRLHLNSADELKMSYEIFRLMLCVSMFWTMINFILASYIIAFFFVLLIEQNRIRKLLWRIVCERSRSLLFALQQRSQFLGEWI